MQMYSQLKEGGREPAHSAARPSHPIRRRRRESNHIRGPRPGHDAMHEGQATRRRHACRVFGIACHLSKIFHFNMTFQPRSW